MHRAPPAHKAPAPATPGQIVNPVKPTVPVAPAPQENRMHVERFMPNITTLIAFEQGELDEEEAIAFIQDGIDKGWVWHLQGCYGRTATALIQAGHCHRPTER